MVSLLKRVRSSPAGHDRSSMEEDAFDESAGMGPQSTSTPTPALTKSALAAIRNCNEKEDLLLSLKKEVKRMIQEAATRKFLNEDSPILITLCNTVDQILRHKLKRRIRGFIGQNCTSEMLYKLHSADAKEVLSEMNDAKEGSGGLSFSSSATDGSNGGRSPMTAALIRLRWIHIALVRKKLVSLLCEIIDRFRDFYSSDAFMADPVRGPLMTSLLAGVNDIEFTKLKKIDCLFLDPNADDLLARQRLQRPDKISCRTRPDFQLRSHSSLMNDANLAEILSARDYVESLHQNTKNSLLFGKNSILMQPSPDVDLMPGYLSLHQTPFSTLIVKWTPNQLLQPRSPDSCVGQRRQAFSFATTGCASFDLGDGCGEEGTEQRSHDDTRRYPWQMRETCAYVPYHLNNEIHMYWKYALTIDLTTIDYIHTHCSDDQTCEVVFIANDGIQYSPMHFNRFNDMLAFLVLIEQSISDVGTFTPPIEKKKTAATSFHLNTKSLIVVDEEIDCLSTGKVGHETQMLPKLKRRISNALSRNPANTVPRRSSSSHLSVSTSGRRTSSEASSPPASPRDPNTPVEDQFYHIAFAPDIIEQYNIALRAQKLQRQDSILSENQLAEFEESSPSRIATPTSPSTSIVNTLEHRRIQNMVNTMEKQMLSRAFFGWLAHHRQVKSVKKQLSNILISPPDLTNIDFVIDEEVPLDSVQWQRIRETHRNDVMDVANYHIFKFGIAADIRKKVWPYLLQVFQLSQSQEEMDLRMEAERTEYEAKLSEWLRMEELAAAMIAPKPADVTKEGRRSEPPGTVGSVLVKHDDTECLFVDDDIEVVAGGGDANLSDRTNDSGAFAPLMKSSSLPNLSTVFFDLVIDRSNSINNGTSHTFIDSGYPSTKVDEDRHVEEEEEYDGEKLATWAINLTRIDKDVHRCDRNLPFYHDGSKLKILRRIMCTFVWSNLECGYIQGMCDLVAPFLVILEDELLTYVVFKKYMASMLSIFPSQSSIMDEKFSNMRSMIQVLDPDLFRIMHAHGDSTHFYFCYRWFLLDFKREFVYDDVFTIWETIWSARSISSTHFQLFIALALIEHYREVIINNDMEFTDIIRFFNEMAEKHNGRKILATARELLQSVNCYLDT